MNQSYESQVIPVAKIFQSYKKNKHIVNHTPLSKSNSLSEKYNANIYLKRQDLQIIRSFKLRGAATAISNLSEEQRKKGVVTASAGNHAQGIAYCCNKLKIKGTIFMPSITPKIKINSVKHFGGEWLQLVLTGLTFDDANHQANKFRQRTGAQLIHAFDNLDVIEGQGGVAVQILQDFDEKSLDYVFSCCGGGGLCSGIASYLSQMSPQTKLIGFEPQGSPSMYNSLQQNKPVILSKLDTFCDGASIKATGIHTFRILNQLNIPIKLVSQGLVTKTMLDIYNEQAIILQPAGALSVAGLQIMKEEIKGKNIVCVLTGSNNDISRLPQIRLRSRLYQNKQAYYIISSMIQINIRILLQKLFVPQQNQLIFINSAKKYNISSVQCMIGVQFQSPQNKVQFQQRIIKNNYRFKQLKPVDPLFRILI